MPIAPTSQLPEGLHYRLHYLLSGLSENELDKTFVHPERGKMFRIRDMICLYA